MLDNGNVWIGRNKDIYEEFWYKYKDNTIICLNYYGGNEITYDYELEDDHTTYTTQEFLDKYNKKEEEIKIGDKRYNKREVEKALKNIKPL